MNDIATVLPFAVPRRNRDLARGRAASDRVRQSGGTTMAAALASIDAAFNNAAIANGFKLRVERTIRLGTGHPAVRARYGARAALLRGKPIDAAIVTVDRWLSDEMIACGLGAALGVSYRLPVEVLSEMRLILRLIRRSLLRDHFAEIVALVGSNR